MPGATNAGVAVSEPRMRMHQLPAAFAELDREIDALDEALGDAAQGKNGLGHGLGVSW